MAIIPPSVRLTAPRFRGVRLAGTVPSEERPMTNAEGVPQRFTSSPRRTESLPDTDKSNGTDAITALLMDVGREAVELILDGHQLPFEFKIRNRLHFIASTLSMRAKSAKQFSNLHPPSDFDLSHNLGSIITTHVARRYE